ncbi:MAG: putative baseplate assembly protein [Anaerolineae bacterium]|nr:putative baseplate assembly protein [Anaerolineae bacterium]
MATQYRCKNQQRAKDILGKAGFNGIDYLEVSGDQKTLRIYCVNDLVLPYAGTVVITGGVRVQGATLAEASPGGERVVIDGELRVAKVTAGGKVITVTVNQPGDFSAYTLRLIASPTNLRAPAGFDRQLSDVIFSFKVDCPSDFDCAPETVCPPEPLPEPEINYLAKDYASFRRLLLDRINVIMPSWQERNPADIEVALVELLAYVGDHLSYFQDAAATEAYLGTARQRISVRRHARLLDYFMHDGCNARAWVCFDYAGASDLTLPGGHPLLTRGEVETPRVAPADLARVLAEEKPEAFETLHPITLQAARSEIKFYTWGDSDCCLPAGATQATLVITPGLVLAVGDVLIFEEVKSPTTGLSSDADPAHRHAVRLTEVDATVEDTLPVTAVKLIEIAWAAEDALPFPLCLSAITDQDERITDVSVARGNVALVDHGLRVSPLEELEPAPDSGAYRPRLQQSPLTQQGQVRDLRNPDVPVIFDATAPASAALRWELRDVQPWIRLLDGGVEWAPQRDLLGSDRFATEFVVEVEADGVPTLRFGDNVLGQRPEPGTRFKARYRVGNGVAGNVGAGAIARVVSDNADILRVWNPLPAVGGVDPEAMAQVRQFAPQAFRVQARAVTPADYVEVTQRRADIQRAAATMRWTGSWYTAFVTADRAGGLAVDDRFETDLRGYLDRYRMAGVDLEINGPIPVPLELALLICVKPDHFRSDVKQALLRVFSSRTLPDGRRGFFHPDNFTFGQSLYLSRVYQAALAVDGVESVEVMKFQRWGKTPHGELAAEVLTTGPFEVIRLDNDPNFPENGKIEFTMDGGL